MTELTQPHQPHARTPAGADPFAAAEALREILQLISRSRADEQPVFEAILRHVSILCRAPLAFLSIANRQRSHATIPAQLGTRPDFAAVLEAFREPIEGSELVAIRPISEGRAIRQDDIADDPLYHARNPRRVQMVEVEGVRSILAVPLMTEAGAVGAIVLYRREVAPFSDADLALAETFAEQAVIAIENARQFRQLEERLARERATREVLNAISRSRADEQPVFEVILERASALCHAPFAGLYLVDGARQSANLVTSIGARPDYLERALTSWPLDNGASVPRAIASGAVVHVEDLADTDLYRAGDRQRVEAVDIEGIRSFLAVPLMRDGEAIGCLGLYRRVVQPFEETEIALVETFAAQAVIAIENVRQFRELQTRLERERANRKILEVISESRAEAEPVFDTVLETALRLCSAQLAGLLLPDAEGLHLEIAAHRSAGLGLTDLIRRQPMPIEPERFASATAFVERRVVHIEDLADTDLYRTGEPFRKQAVDDEGIRTILYVPLTFEDEATGVLILYRTEVRAFDEGEIALVRTFATQAAIAIENVRQFRELQTRLERESATREVLQVISGSRDDDAPVFKAILENAQRLCGAPFGNLNMVSEDGARLEIVADGLERFEPFRPGWSWPIESGLLVARSVRDCAVHQLEDAALDPLYGQGDQDRVTVVEAGVRTVLTVPLISNGVGIGSMGLYRREKRRFTPDEIALVETFAEQAVIAIENVRQFRALEARSAEVEALNADLETRVDAQVGEIERMGRLKRFLSPAVADAVVSSGDEAMLGSHRALIGVLFCDIRGFTAFCERAEPEESIEVLQTYHEEMGRLINAHGAGVDHRSGDGIMVIFNDPLPCEDPAGEALRLALAMRERMAELCRAWKRLGHRLGFGVGISLGYATVGMVGSEGRYDYTASGTAVNLAARLCDHAEDGEILLSPRAYAAVEDDVAGESHGELELKGIAEPVEVFRVSS